MNIKKTSKFLSLILRHKPEAINIELDQNGFADVNELLKGMQEAGTHINFDTLKQIVDTDEKVRYSFNSDFSKIRANQGHSVNVDVELKGIIPPETLYHGTVERFYDSIKKDGLIPKSRLYVHLSKDIDTAKVVAKRRGKPFLLAIDTKQMSDDGIEFFISENKVYLVKEVPPHYISVLEAKQL